MTSNVVDSACKCTHCGGQDLALKDLTLGFEYPDYVFDISPRKAQKSLNAMKNNYTMKIYNEERYFVRGAINFPVHGETREYIVGIWMEVSKSDFEVAQAATTKTTILGTIANKTKFESPPGSLFGTLCAMALQLINNQQDHITLLDVRCEVTHWQKNGITRDLANRITLSNNNDTNN